MYSQRGSARLFSGRGFFISAAFIGNQGFDPLGLATAETLVPLRHAELKHGRLAMLAAVGWPAQELLHPVFVEALKSFSVHDTLADGLAPTVLNGALNQPECAPALAAGIVVGSSADLFEIGQRSRKGLPFNEWALDSVAGDVSFDPLRISAKMPVTERFELQEAEMLNGRLAMLVVVAYCLIEAAGIPAIHPELLRELLEQ